MTENSGGLKGINENPKQATKRNNFWSTIKPAYFGTKIASKNLFHIFQFITVGLSIGILSKFSLGSWLLLNFLAIFSLGWFRNTGPTEAEIAGASFQVWFVGHGFSDSSRVSQGNAKPDMEIITRVMGPEFGYAATPIILIQCALVVLKQREDLPMGGVYTPGMVFGPTDLQERLQENGISFDIVSKSDLSNAMK